MDKFNGITFRNIKESDEEQVASIFVDAFSSKVKSMSYLPNDKLKDFIIDAGVIETSYKEGYIIAKRNSEIVGIMLLKWRGQSKGKERNINLKILFKKYGFNRMVKAIFKTFFILTEQKNDEMYVDHIAVSKNARGQGVGGLLLDKATEIAISNNNIKRITLSVIDENPSAHKLYEKKGFKDIKHSNSKIAKWAIGIDGFTIMEKRIR